MRVAATATGLALAGVSWLPVQAAIDDAVGGRAFEDNFDVFLLRSTDRGQSFDRFTNLSDDISESTMAKVAAADGTVHVSWRNGEQPREIFYRSSATATAGGDDGGFGPAVNISANSGDSAEADLAVSGGRVNVVWSDDLLLPDLTTPDPRYLESNEIYGRSAPADGGAEFAAPEDVSVSQGGHSRDPDIAAVGQLAVVVYEDIKDTGADGIFANFSTDGGQTWGEAPVNISGAAGSQTETSVDIGNNRVHATWQDDEGVIGYSQSADLGRTWSEPIALPEVPDAETPTPVVAAANNRVHVLACGGDTVYYLRSTDNGATWEDPIPFSDDSGCGNPTVAARGTDVYGVWDAGPEDFQEIFFRRSTDAGASFTPEENVSNNLGESAEPSLAVDDSTGHVYLTWADTTTPLTADRPAISVDDVTVREPADESASATAAFTVTLDRPSEDEVTVELASLDGSAEAGDDFEEREAFVVFPAGETSRTVEFAVLFDEEAEDDETFEVVLLNPQIGVVVDDARGVATIIDAAGP